MRARISPTLERHIYALALRQGRSDANMLDRIIEAGLAATGFAPEVMTPPLGSLSDAEMSEVKVPLDAELRASLRALAAKHDRPQRQLAARVLREGLAALGADSATVAAVEADHATTA
jgi:hypothetical protein